jgi:flagellar FliJ protein
MEGQVADPKRRIPILKRLIADCDRLAADLDQEVRNEENRVRIHNPANSAYSTYARAAALRRDNLRRSAREPQAFTECAIKIVTPLLSLG